MLDHISCILYFEVRRYHIKPYQSIIYCYDTMLYHITLHWIHYAVSDYAVMLLCYVVLYYII